MTTRLLKKNPPKIQVKVGGKIIEAQVAAGSTRMATVYNIKNPKRSWEFSWATISHALRESRHLVVQP